MRGNMANLSLGDIYDVNWPKYSHAEYFDNQLTATD